MPFYITEAIPGLISSDYVKLLHSVGLTSLFQVHGVVYQIVVFDRRATENVMLRISHVAERERLMRLT